MEANRENLKKTFSHVKLSADKKKELITIMENVRKPKRFIARRLLVTAVIMALAVALAMGANAATNGELLESLGKLVATFRLDSGEVRIYQGNETSMGTTYYIETDGPFVDAYMGDVATTENEVTISIDENENFDVYWNGEKVEPESPAPAESAAP